MEGAHRYVEIKQMYKWEYNNHNYLLGLNDITYLLRE